MIDNSNRILINVYGAPRSGSTMLDVMLGAAKGAISLGEVAAWYRIGKFCGDALAPSDAPPDIRGRWSALEMVSERNFHRRAFDKFDSRVLIDSSKDWYWILDVYNKFNANEFFIVNVVIYKKPLGFAYSNWKRGYEWKEDCIRFYSRIIDSGIPFISVRLDQIIEDVNNTIGSLYDVIGLELESGSSHGAFWKQIRTHRGGSPGVSDQMKRGKSSLEVKPYDPEFEGEIARVRQEVETSDRVRYVLDQLSSRNIFVNKSPDYVHRSDDVDVPFRFGAFRKILKYNWLMYRTQQRLAWKYTLQEMLPR